MKQLDVRFTVEQESFHLEMDFAPFPNDVVTTCAAVRIDGQTVTKTRRFRVINREWVTVGNTTEHQDFTQCKSRYLQLEVTEI